MPAPGLLRCCSPGLRRAACEADTAGTRWPPFACCWSPAAGRRQSHRPPRRAASAPPPAGPPGPPPRTARRSRSSPGTCRPRGRSAGPWTRRWSVNGTPPGFWRSTPPGASARWVPCRGCAWAVRAGCWGSRSPNRTSSTRIRPGPPATGSSVSRCTVSPARCTWGSSGRSSMSCPPPGSTMAGGSPSGRMASSTPGSGTPRSRTPRRTPRAWAARSCAWNPMAASLRTTRSPVRPSTAWATATCRAWPGTGGAGCTPASSGRTPSMS